MKVIEQSHADSLTFVISKFLLKAHINETFKSVNF